MLFDLSIEFCLITNLSNSYYFYISLYFAPRLPMVGQYKNHSIIIQHLVVMAHCIIMTLRAKKVNATLLHPILKLMFVIQGPVSF